MNNHNIIGERIRAARLAKNMTQEELGEILGVQKSTVAKYENGRVVNIKRTALKKISDVLDIPPFDLVYDGENENPANDDGISEKKRELMQFVQTVPDDKVAMILRVMKSILENS